MLRSLVVCQLLAFWPVWQWYWRRLKDPCDSALCVLPLIVALFWFLNVNKRREESRSYTLATLMTLTYAIALPFMPPLIKATIAIVALSALLSASLGRTLHLPLTGLLVLALPIIPTAQFYLGYPLRAAVAACSVPVLCVTGFNVTRQGTCLAWQGELVSVDAPCSGISMLWAGAFLALCLALIHQYNDRDTVQLCLLTFGLLFAGNVLRTSTLFVVQTGGLSGTPFLHEGVGLFVFALTSFLIVKLAQLKKVHHAL